MRLFIIGLVALNILYFIWSSMDDEKSTIDSTLIARGSAGVPLLVRVNEAGNPPSVSSAVPMGFDLPDEQSVPASKPVSAGRYCYTLGPFGDTEAVEKVQGLLMASGVTADIRDTKERKQRGYWVYLPPHGSREEALAVSRQLAENGLKDYFVINDAKFKHAISLGLFSKKSGSERRMREVKSMGLEPKLDVRYREEAVFWLDYETVDPFDDLLSITGLNRDKTIEQLDRECI